MISTVTLIVKARSDIQLPSSAFDKVLEKAGIAAFLALWGLVLFALFSLPIRVPIHYNASGKPDNYGSKIVLLCLPVLATFLFWLLSYVNRYPGILSHLGNLADDRALNEGAVNEGEVGVSGEPAAGAAARQMKLATRMLRYLKFAIALIFIVIVLFNYLTILGRVNGLEPWLLPFIPALVLIPSACYIYISLKRQTRR